jgi:uncharacterized membrane protein
VCFSAAGYVLLEVHHQQWLGSLAMVMAAVYALTAQLLLFRPPLAGRMVLVSLAISAGYIALAFPLQADTNWVALGWATQAAVLWWFGLRVEARPLRWFSGALAALACVWILIFNTQALPWDVPIPYLPMLNSFALPALAATVCIAVGLVFTRKWIGSLQPLERGLAGLAAVGCLLMVWFIVSVDLFRFFEARSTQPEWASTWRRLAGTSLSAWWAIYASLILAGGFKTNLPLMRWTALGLYALTLGKVFLVDMAGLDEIYRIVAFVVLAVVLGLAAWAYQRVQPEPPPVPVDSREE